jgi:hypothetical protein
MLGAVAVLIYPTVHFYLGELRLEPGSQVAVQRYILLSVLHFLVPFSILAIFLTIGLGSIQLGHTLVYRGVLEPIYQATVSNARMQLQASDYYRSASETLQTRLLTDLDSKAKEFGNKVFNNGIVQDIRNGLGVLMAGMILPILAAGILGFIIPYLVLGGWRRGIFYMIVILISWQAEGLVEKSVPSTFLLQSDSILTTGFIILCVLFNALLFESIFERLIEHNEPCPNCGALVNEEDLYCPHCGLAAVPSSTHTSQ